MICDKLTVAFFQRGYHPEFYRVKHCNRRTRTYYIIFDAITQILYSQRPSRTTVRLKTVIGVVVVSDKWIVGNERYVLNLKKNYRKEVFNNDNDDNHFR